MSRPRNLPPLAEAKLYSTARPAINRNRSSHDLVQAEFYPKITCATVSQKAVVNIAQAVDIVI